MSSQHPLLPDLYDLDVGDFNDDIQLYENFARAADGPILELGVGTGRAAIPLAEAGHEVWGIDSSREMLARARSKVAEAGAQCLELREHDMRTFDLNQTFAMIYAGYGAFHHLTSTEDQAACLSCVAKHLAPAGVFVCDLRPWFHDGWESGDSLPLFHDWTRTLPSTGEVVTKSHSVRPDAARQLKRHTNLYDLIDGEGQVRRITEEVDLRFTTRYEMEGLLQDAGLALDEVYGNYDLASFEGDSEYMITVAHKPENA